MLDESIPCELIRDFQIDDIETNLLRVISPALILQAPNN